jgi:hypothetical protein
MILNTMPNDAFLVVDDGVLVHVKNEDIKVMALLLDAPSMPMLLFR